MAIVVAGEALIDLAPRDGLLQPLAGGSPFNVAVGLGRLGVEVSYLGGLSDDGFGRLLEKRLTVDGVDLDLAVSTRAPTTLAIVHLDPDGHAGYAFYLAGTSAAVLEDADLPLLPPAAALHVSLGAVTLTSAPAGLALAMLLEREHGQRLVSLDPNVRPNVIEDLAAYATYLDAAIAAIDLVKASDEDLALLHPGDDAREVAARWAQSGPALVVVTLGRDGAVAVTADGSDIEVPGEPVEVVDTVGAGDAFTSALLAWLDAHGRLSRDAVADLPPGDLEPALAHAVRAAAITCTRVGADPPRASDLATTR